MTQLVRLGLLAAGLAVATGNALAQDAAPRQHIPLQKTIGKVTPTAPVPSLFVLNSEGATLKDGKLTMSGVSPNSIVFADRPVRAAGHVMTAQFVQQWDEDKGNFVVEPPNGTISVLGGVGADVSDAVVTLMKPVLEGTTLTFDVKVLEGSLAGSGPAALFIDRGGFGGGGFQQFFFTAAPGYRHSTGNQIAIQARGNQLRLLIAGYSANAQDLDPSMGLYAMNFLTGAADPSFNGGVARVFDYAASGIHGDAYAAAVLPTPDGKILIGGGYEATGFTFGDAALTRLNDDGSFDSSFGALAAALPGRAGYGHSLNSGDRDNRLASMALLADGERVVFSGYAYASDDGSYYGSVMRARLYAADLLRNGFE